MKKHLSVYAISLLMLAGCSSVPITGRKQLLLVSDQEVLSSSLTQYNSYIKSAQKSTNAAQTAMVVRVGKTLRQLRNNTCETTDWQQRLKNFPGSSTW